MTMMTKRLFSLVAAGIVFAASLAGCGSNAPESPKADAVKMKPIQTLKLAGKDVPLYELTGIELPHFVESCLAVTSDAVYAPTQEKGENDAHLWKFPMKGDKLSAGQEIGLMKLSWLTTNGKNVYFCQGNHVQGIYDGSAVHQAALSSNRERSVRAVYGSDTVYFDREGASATAGITRGTLTKDGFSNPKLLLATFGYMDQRKAAKDEVAPKLIAADTDGFYMQWTARNGSNNGTGWTKPVYAFDPDGKELRSFEMNTGLAEGMQKASASGPAFVTRDYVGFTGRGLFRIFDKKTGSAVGDIIYQIDDKVYTPDTIATDDTNHVYFTLYDNKQKVQHIYRIDL